MNRIASIPFRFPTIPGVNCLFTTRWPQAEEEADSGNLSRLVSGGHPEAEANIRRLRQGYGFSAWQELRQVHGTGISFLELEPGEGDPPPQADALATSLPGRALVVKVADCQPVLMAHSSGGFVAALHVGWRANRENAPGLWVKAFCEHYGLLAKDLFAVRGPSLSPRASEFVNFQLEWGEDFRDYFRPGDKTVDLWALTRDQLHQAGIPREQIHGLDLCTYTLSELFFSHRRDGDPRRQAGLIWISGS